MVVSGAVTTALPAGITSIASLFPYDPLPADGDCGTVEVPLDNGTIPSGTGLADIDVQVMSCVLGAATSNRPGHLRVVMRSPQGGDITADVSIAGASSITISMVGTIEVSLPSGLAVPDDLLKAIPSGSMGMSRFLPSGGRQ